MSKGMQVLGGPLASNASSAAARPHTRPPPAAACLTLALAAYHNYAALQCAMRLPAFVRASARAVARTGRFKQVAQERGAKSGAGTGGRSEKAEESQQQGGGEWYRGARMHGGAPKLQCGQRHSVSISARPANMRAQRRSAGRYVCACTAARFVACWLPVQQPAHADWPGSLQRSCSTVAAAAAACRTCTCQGVQQRGGVGQ